MKGLEKLLTVLELGFRNKGSELQDASTRTRNFADLDLSHALHLRSKTMNDVADAIAIALDAASVKEGGDEGK